MRRFVVVVVAVLVSSLAAGAGRAAPTPGGWIFATDIYTGGHGSVAIPGGGGTPVPSCPGDPTNGAGARLFVRAENHVLVWSDDTCLSRPMHAEPSASVAFGGWSPNGLRVAFVGWWDTIGGEGQTVRHHALYVGDVVVSDGGRSLANVRQAVYPYYGSPFNWAPDSSTVTFWQGTKGDIYVASLDDGDDLGAVQITATPEAETYPAFSPDGTRIAFARQTVFKGNLRADVFTMPAAGGPATQVTSKTNTNASSNIQPSWSPDGQYLAFGCSPVAGGRHVCRIDAAGRAKATDLTPKLTASFGVWGWRS